MLLTATLLLTAPVAGGPLPATWAGSLATLTTASHDSGDWGYEDESDWNDDWDAPPAPTEDELDTTLSPYGEWLVVDGHRVWRPTYVNADWQPYTNGHWIYTDVGWTWVSHWAWGWVPFHYGRWHRHAYHGWVWYPGRVWAPAWVAWRYGDGWVSWAALPPTVTWSFHTGGFVNVNVFASFDPYLWVAVYDYDFLSPRLGGCLWSASRVRSVVPRAQVQLPYVYDREHRRLHHHGVPLPRIERAHGQPVRVQRLTERHHGHPHWRQARTSASNDVRPPPVTRQDRGSAHRDSSPRREPDTHRSEGSHEREQRRPPSRESRPPAAHSQPPRESRPPAVRQPPRETRPPAVRPQPSHDAAPPARSRPSPRSAQSPAPRVAPARAQSPAQRAVRAPASRGSAPGAHRAARGS